MFFCSYSLLLFLYSTHGFIKKRSKVPDNQIQKAKQLRTKYFEDKEKQLKKKKK